MISMHKLAGPKQTEESSKSEERLTFWTAVLRFATAALGLLAAVALLIGK